MEIINQIGVIIGIASGIATIIVYFRLRPKRRKKNITQLRVEVEIRNLVDRKFLNKEINKQEYTDLSRKLRKII